MKFLDVIKKLKRTRCNNKQDERFNPCFNIADVEKNQSVKADAGKPDLRLLGGFLLPLLSGIARVREFGVKKYKSENSWRNVEPERYKSALFRHLSEWLDDEYSVDEESGLSHLYHAACNIAFLMWFDSNKRR